MNNIQLSNWKSELSHASELLIKLLSEGEAPVLVPCADCLSEWRSILEYYNMWEISGHMTSWHLLHTASHGTHYIIQRPMLNRDHRMWWWPRSQDTKHWSRTALETQTGIWIFDPLSASVTIHGLVLLWSPPGDLHLILGTFEKFRRPSGKYNCDHCWSLCWSDLSYWLLHHIVTLTILWPG